MELKIGSGKAVVDYLTGVKQGDVLAPTLFLFMMQAVAERIVAQWSNNGITPLKYLYESSGCKGQLVRQPKTTYSALPAPTTTVAEILLLL